MLPNVLHQACAFCRRTEGPVGEAASAICITSTPRPPGHTHLSTAVTVRRRVPLSHGSAALGAEVNRHELFVGNRIGDACVVRYPAPLLPVRLDTADWPPVFRVDAVGGDVVAVLVTEATAERLKATSK